MNIKLNKSIRIIFQKNGIIFLNEKVKKLNLKKGERKKYYKDYNYKTLTRTTKNLQSRI